MQCVIRHSLSLLMKCYIKPFSNTQKSQLLTSKYNLKLHFFAWGTEPGEYWQYMFFYITATTWKKIIKYKALLWAARRCFKKKYSNCMIKTQWSSLFNMTIWIVQHIVSYHTNGFGFFFFKENKEWRSIRNVCSTDSHVLMLIYKFWK